jgi:ribosomal protein L28
LDHTFLALSFSSSLNESQKKKETKRKWSPDNQPR